MLIITCNALARMNTSGNIHSRPHSPTNCAACSGLGLQIDQLRQVHSGTMQRRPVNLCQPVGDTLWITPRQTKGQRADCQQHQGAGEHVLRQVRALLPAAVEGIEQW